MSYSLAIDIGGTFTDLVLLGEDGTMWVEKVLSTPRDYSIGIMSGIEDLLAKVPIGPEHVSRVVHATTIATNIILERKGARTALVTTKGFRDILEMRRLRIPVLYNLQYKKPVPLVSRHLSFEVAERSDPEGNIVVALQEPELEALVTKLKSSEAESIAICFLHSYANPAHEILVETYLRNHLSQEIFICRSSDILPKLREYERCSTTVVNAYVGPKVRQYLTVLAARLNDAGLGCPINIMHSAGGIMSIKMAQKLPVYLAESGPAAGVTGCAVFAAMAGNPNVISFDMGGTTTKTAIVENGEPAKTDEYEVGSGISTSSKLVKGGGYPIGLPFIDVSEIGAGGGSIISLSQHGQLTVGPGSAGALPGPVCYDMGGTEPTLTDALVLLGYINPDYLAGGSIKLNAKKAETVFTDAIARPLKRSTVEAASGIFRLAVNSMTRAVKAVSTYRGRDPREYTLVAFGGNGPVVAVELATALNMTKVLIPPAAGVFSAVGLLVSRIEHEFVKSVLGLWKRLDECDLEQLFQSLADEARQRMAEEGVSISDYELVRYAELRYSGQAYDLTVPVDSESFSYERARTNFDDSHYETYGHKSSTDPVELVTLKVVARDTRAVQMTSMQLHESMNSHGSRTRNVYFDSTSGYMETPVLERSDLCETPQPGPAIVEDYDSTCVVPPGWSMWLDGNQNMHIELNG